MNGIHDMGGMHGFGRVEVEEDEPVFHERWQGRVFGMNSLILARWGNVDAFRHSIERLAPATYLTAGYYGRWLGAAEAILEEKGVILAGELDARMAGEVVPSGPGTGFAPPSGGGTSVRETFAAPRFGVGENVRAKNLQPAGHTRLPGYARGKRGAIARVHPACVFPDTNAHDRGENPQYVYAVRFAGGELWGGAAEPGTFVHIDLFESYLESEAT